MYVRPVVACQPIAELFCHFSVVALIALPTAACTFSNTPTPDCESPPSIGQLRLEFGHMAHTMIAADEHFCGRALNYFKCVEVERRSQSEIPRY